LYFARRSKDTEVLLNRYVHHVELGPYHLELKERVMLILNLPLSFVSLLYRINFYSPTSSDPSSYHPNSLMPLTRPLLPPSLRAPPPSSNPLQSPSPFLPLTHHSNLNTDTKLAASQKSGSGGSIMGLGKEAGAVANVLFSAGGVAGGVWWVGRKSTHWSLETVRVKPLLYLPSEIGA
jgi:hypothetical protein